MPDATRSRRWYQYPVLLPVLSTGGACHFREAVLRGPGQLGLLVDRRSDQESFFPATSESNISHYSALEAAIIDGRMDTMRHISPFALLLGALLIAHGRAEVCPCNTTLLCEPIATIHTREIFIFHLSGGTKWRSYDWSIITTVAVFGGQSIEPDLYCFAHSMGARVVLVAANFNISKAADPAARTAWAREVATNVNASRADGINLDIEFAESVAQPDGISAVAAEVVSLLRAANSHAQVSFDVSIHPLWHTVGYNYTALAAICDFLVP